jgi:hypothetical protein
MLAWHSVCCLVTRPRGRVGLKACWSRTAQMNKRVGGGNGDTTVLRIHTTHTCSEFPSSPALPVPPVLIPPACGPPVRCAGSIRRERTQRDASHAHTRVETPRNANSMAQVYHRLPHPCLVSPPVRVRLWPAYLPSTHPPVRCVQTRRGRQTIRSADQRDEETAVAPCIDIRHEPPCSR